jgi:DNA glycosylase AlkZ-like
MRKSDIARLRLDHQRLTRPSFTTPADVVRWFGAVQSQDLAASLCAIGLRMRHATEAQVEQALADRSIVRSWPMRRTIHCMVAEDVRWMIRLLAPRGIARMNPYHRRMGIGHDELARAGRVFETALTRHKQLTRAELYQRLNHAGIATTAPGIPMRGGHLLVHWAQAGLICIAARKGKQPTFALLDEWTPRGRDLSGDEALAELATIYFRAHAPATANDFAWWAGFTLKEANRALLLIAGQLESTKVDGVEYWLPRAAPAASSGPLSTLLLPPFDEYTVAYADRSAAAEKSILRSTAHGLAPNILIDGRIAGTWKRTLLGNDTVAITPHLLRILNRKEQIGLAQAAERYAAFLDRKLVADKTSKLLTRVQKGKTLR